MTDATLLSRAERLIVWLIGGGALLSVPLSLLTLVASGIRFATQPTVRVAGLPIAESGYPAFLQASDAPVDAGYETAWVEVANLPSAARWLLWTEQALPVALALVIAVAIGWLALALLRGAPFTRAFPAVLGVVAIAVIAAGLGAQAVGGIARAEVVSFLGAAVEVAGGSEAGEGFLAFAVTFDLAPLGWGLGIALVAAAFTIGTRLQRDTRGLV